MDTPLESVDNIPFATPDKVKPVHESNKDRQRKFSKELKEKMEEKQQKDRRRKREDQFIHENDAEQNEQMHDGEEDNTSDRDLQTSIGRNDAVDEPERPRTDRVDVKA